MKRLAERRAANDRRNAADAQRQKELEVERRRLTDQMHGELVDETRRLLAEKQRAIADEIGRLKVGQTRRAAFNARLAEQLQLIRDREVSAVA